jgi:hypothetical protein
MENWTQKKKQNWPHGICDSAAWELHFMFIYYISLFDTELGHSAPAQTAFLDNVNSLNVQVIWDVMECWLVSHYQSLEGL